MLNLLNNYHVQCRYERIIKSSIDLIAKLKYITLKESPISRFDMSCAQAHWVRSKPIFRVMQLKLHEPTMANGYSLVRTTCMSIRPIQVEVTLYLGQNR